MVRAALAQLPQFAAMAAIVATLAWLPLGIVAALVLWSFGVSPLAVLSFGGAAHEALGLLAWWAVLFAAACGYAAWVFPWPEDDAFRAGPPAS